MLSVQFQDKEPAPTFLAHEITATKTALTVQSTLSSRGSVSCAAYPVDPRSGASTVPSSAGSILLQNFGASTNAANETTVTMTGLSAASSYVVYCMSVSPAGTQTSLTDVIASAETVSTACCIAAVVHTSVTSVKESTTTAQFMSITVAARPADSIVLTLSAYTVSNGVLTLVTPAPFFPATFTGISLGQLALQ
jgi:hypothetical protein